MITSQPTTAEGLKQALTARSKGSLPAPWLAQIISQQRLGHTALPCDLGLGEHFQPFLAHCFDDAQALVSPNEQQQEKDQLLSLLYQRRQDEKQQVQELLMEGIASTSKSEQTFLAMMVSTACLGYGHLWQDLGLATRPELGDMLRQFFPEIAAKNTNNMRWKKFFYKQLCEQEGGTLCRAPTCDECKNYKECF